MFRLFFNGRKQDEQKSAVVDPTLEKKDSAQCDDKAHVYVWSGSEGVGHVAIRLGADRPGNYCSIWPKNIPAIGPTAILPLPAMLATQLGQDAYAESPSAMIAFGDPSDTCHAMSSAGSRAVESVLPDKVFTISGLNMAKMKAEKKRIANGVETGAVCYQLFPGVRTMALLNYIVNTAVLDPDVTPKPSAFDDALPEIYNCATLAQHLLSVGGMDTLSPPTWRPSTFSGMLSKQPNTSVNDLSQQATSSLRL